MGGLCSEIGKVYPCIYIQVQSVGPGSCESDLVGVNSLAVNRERRIKRESWRQLRPDISMAN